MDVVGREQAKGVMKVEPCASGQSPGHQDIIKAVIRTGQGAGDKSGRHGLQQRCDDGSVDGPGVRRAFAKGAERADQRRLAQRRPHPITDFTAEA